MHIQNLKDMRQYRFSGLKVILATKGNILFPIISLDQTLIAIIYTLLRRCRSNTETCPLLGFNKGRVNLSDPAFDELTVDPMLLLY